MAELDSDVRRVQAIEDRYKRSTEYSQDIGFLLAKIGRLGRDHSRLHGVADKGRDFLAALERAEEDAKRKRRMAVAETSTPFDDNAPVDFPLKAVRAELIALADSINDLDRTLNRSD